MNDHPENGKDYNMREQNLKRTLGKIHPREELVERVKQHADEPASYGRAGIWRYAGAVAAVAVLLLAGTVGIWQHRNASIGASPSETELPTQMQRAEPVSQQDQPAEAALKENTVVCEGLTIWMLDACSAQEQEALLSEAEEGTICYTGDLAEALKNNQELALNLSSETDGAGGAVFVYHNGQWQGKLLEWSEEEIVAFARTVLDGTR